MREEAVGNVSLQELPVNLEQQTCTVTSSFLPSRGCCEFETLFLVAKVLEPEQ